MRIVIDIDGVLCDEGHKDVSQRVPYTNRIAFLNDMYNRGHEIVIFTSRGMKSCNNNQVEADKKYRSLSEKQFADWGLQYHELYFGKPNADLYIDNKNILMQDFFNQ